MALCALDNLTKGASGGALQSANVALGLDETLGLPWSGCRRDDPFECAACAWTPHTGHSDGSNTRMGP